ncbi:hypothetical protein ACFLRC_04700, partial [Candidatus Altiarchaeota archaeon]
MEIGLPLGFVALMHYKLGKYPQSLPSEGDKQKVIWETLILWALLTIVFAVIIFSGFVGKGEKPTPSVMLQLILFTAPFYVLIPVAYLALVKKWTLRDFGLRHPVPNSRAVIIFAVFIFALSGALPLLN